MIKEWEFELYPVPERRILDIIPEHEKAVHVSGAKIYFEKIRWHLVFRYEFKGRSISVFGTPLDIEDGMTLDAEAPENQYRIAPECQFDLKGPIRAVNIQRFDPESVQQFIAHFCSFLAEYHNSFVLLDLPEDHELILNRKIEIRRMRFGSRIAKALHLEKTEFDIGEKKNQ